jgi:hypothetical protein
MDYKKVYPLADSIDHVLGFKEGLSGLFYFPRADVRGAVFGGRLLAVDQVNGGGGVRGRLDKSFLHLEGAEAAAQVGDCILVYPGTYTLTSILGKNGLKYLLYPGVTLDGGAGPVFTAAAPMSYTVHAHGATISGGGAGGVVTVSDAGAGVIIEGAVVAATGAALAAVVNVGSLTCRDCVLSSPGGPAAVRHAGGGTRLERCRVTAAAAGVIVEADGLLADLCRVLSAGASFASDAAPTVVNYGSRANMDPSPSVVFAVDPLVVDPVVV